MASFFTILSTGKKFDCAWSKLYFYIFLALLLPMIMIMSYCSSSIRRRLRRYYICQKVTPCWTSAKDHLKRRRYRRKKRYEPLDQDGNAMIKMESSSLHSDSDDSLFESKDLKEKFRD